MMPHRRTFLMLFLAATLTFVPTGIAAAGPLKILLTNDDGYQAIGIKTLRTALENAGYDVTMVAPMTNNSGASASLTLTPVAYKQLNANGYYVDGSPGTCVFAGLSLMQPDLIVSGTNLGANLGRLVTFSGTDGAAFTAIFNDIPAVAFSSDEPPPGLRELHYTNVANFAVRLIEALETGAGAGGELLPPGTMLNVNYPLRLPEDVEGVRLTTQNTEPSPTTVTYSTDSNYPGYLFPVISSHQVPPPPAGTDEAAIDAGFISITLMSADYTVSPGVLRPRVRRLLRDVEP